MAVAEMITSQLRLVFDDGADEITGRPMYKYKSFNNVKTDANAGQLHDIAEALVGLQERGLSKIERKDSSDIKED